MLDRRELDIEFMDSVLAEEHGVMRDLTDVILKRIAAIKAGPVILPAPRKAAAPAPRTGWFAFAAAAALAVGVSFWVVSNNPSRSNVETARVNQEQPVAPPASIVDRKNNTPTVAPQPKVEPKAEPKPEPKIEPTPLPQPQPRPEPTPTPEPTPEPTPTPEHTPTPEPTPEPFNTSIVCGADSKVSVSDGIALLESGWAFLTADTPSLNIGESHIREVNGRVVACVGGPATRNTVNEMEATIKDLNSREKEMLLDAKSWIKKTGFAVCVLAGIAMLDGAQIAAQPQNPAKDAVQLPWTTEDVKAFISEGMRFVYDLQNDGKSIGWREIQVVKVEDKTFTLNTSDYDTGVQPLKSEYVKREWNYFETLFKDLKASDVKVASQKLKIGETTFDCVLLTIEPTDKAMNPTRYTLAKKMPGVLVNVEVLNKNRTGSPKVVEAQLLTLAPLDLQLPWKPADGQKYLNKGTVLAYTHKNTSSRSGGAGGGINFPGTEIKYEVVVTDVNEQGYSAQKPTGFSSKILGMKDWTYRWNEAARAFAGFKSVKTFSEKLVIGNTTLECIVFEAEFKGVEGSYFDRVWVSKSRPGLIVQEQHQDISTLVDGAKSIESITTTLTAVTQPAASKSAKLRAPTVADAKKFIRKDMQFEYDTLQRDASGKERRSKSTMEVVEVSAEGFWERWRTDDEPWGEKMFSKWEAGLPPSPVPKEWIDPKTTDVTVTVGGEDLRCLSHVHRMKKTDKDAKGLMQHRKVYSADKPGIEIIDEISDLETNTTYLMTLVKIVNPK
ncbi:MAG: hypothetical protein IT462_01940 [Planctomycetes bacterium]|nr:hypothetical protein [Planctomycetota bacterium]